MTLIRVFQAFHEWMDQHPFVKAFIKRPGEDLTACQVRNSARLKAELTINAPRRNDSVGAPMVIHTLEFRNNRWLVTAGGAYREVRSGIYDLFDTTTYSISAMKSEEIESVICPYCQILLFGMDGEPCTHQFLRINPAGFWAPGVERLTRELNKNYQLALKTPDDFKKFILANPQLEWKRLSYHEESVNGVIDVLVFLSSDPANLLERYPQWIVHNCLTRNPRATIHGLRLTGKQRLTNSRLKKS